MPIPTEPIGSVPRPVGLLAAIEAAEDESAPSLMLHYEAAICDTIACFEATGSPVITDGEQRKYHTFWTSCVRGIDPRVESPEEIRDRVLEATEFIPVGQRGTTDDCGLRRSATTPRPAVIRPLPRSGPGARDGARVA